MLVLPPLKPELLKRSVKTKSSDWCWLGTSTNAARITATPATCHHTETPLMRATKWLPPMFTAAWSARTIKNRKNVPCRNAEASAELPLNRPMS